LHLGHSEDGIHWNKQPDPKATAILNA
jgi:hypothetical protein